jgi:hypothetical protein
LTHLVVLHDVTGPPIFVEPPLSPSITTLPIIAPWFSPSVTATHIAGRKGLNPDARWPKPILGACGTY